MVIQSVAVVGATGNVGKYIVEALAQAGKHKVTALTRDASKAKVPSGVEAKTINYDDEAGLAKVLKGHDALVITMSTEAPPEQQSKLIDAAAKAGVNWVLPNEWGYGWDDTGAGKDTFLGLRYVPYRKHTEQLGKNWIAVCSGFWYGFSLQYGGFGFDLKSKTATFFDDGDVPFTTSTWPQVGQAVAKLLALPENDLDRFKNSFVYFDSFRTTQKEIFNSILRVTGEKAEDWKVTSEPREERFTSALKALQGGDSSAYLRVLYTRALYPDGSADLEPKGLSNDFLGLPKEDLDTATKEALDGAK